MADGDAAVPLAGTLGFAFARVLVGADGQLMVPHCRRRRQRQPAHAHRLLDSTHRFSTACDDPIEALLHRLGAPALAQERQRDLRDAVGCRHRPGQP